MKLCGIYSITNLVNDKQYVGSTNNYNKRKTQHLSNLRNNRHTNPYLQNAWNKDDGENNFVFNLEVEIDESQLLIVEQIYIDNNIGGYNITKFADAPTRGRRFRGRQVSDQTKMKISESLKGKKHTNETKKKISEIHKGKKLSLDTIIKRTNTRKQNGFFQSLEARQKMSQAIRKPWGKGYSFDKGRNRWRVAIQNKSVVFGGYFKTEQEAISKVKFLRENNIV